MFKIFLLLSGLTERMCNYIGFADGILELRNNNGGEPDCANNQQITKTQQFPGTFYNIPQIIISLEKYEMEIPSNGFTLTYNPSLTSFDATITCTSSYKILTFSFKWVALNDNRIRVINVTADGTSLTTQVINHDLTNAVVGFTSITYFGFTGGGSRIITQIDQITSTNISVYIPFSSQPLGVQAIIGTSDAINIIQKVILGESAWGLPQQLTVIKPSSEYFCFFGSQEYQTSSTTDLEFEIQDVETDTDITLKLSPNTWSKGLSVLQRWFVGISKINYIVDIPLLCTKVRIAKKRQKVVPSFQVELQVIGTTTFTQTINSSYQNTVQSGPGQYATLNVIVSIKCNRGQRIVGQVILGIDCKEQNHDLSTFCYGGMNLVEYRIRLFQKDQVYQQVTFDITNTYVKITQLVKGPDGTLLSLELQ